MNECSCYWILLPGLEKNNVAIVMGTTVYDCGGVLLYNGEGILLAKVTLKLILLPWTFCGEKNKKKTSIIEICINKFVFVTVTKQSCLGKSIHIFPFFSLIDWSLLPTSASPCFSFLRSSFLSILSKKSFARYLLIHLFHSILSKESYFCNIIIDPSFSLLCSDWSLLVNLLLICWTSNERDKRQPPNFYPPSPHHHPTNP